MKKVLLLISLALSCMASPLAEIKKCHGEVKIQSGIKKKNVVIGDKLEEKDLLISEKGATVTLQLADGSHIVMKEASRLTFDSAKMVTQGKGKVYYSIVKRETQGLSVKTDFAIIGVKGTEFIVHDDEKKSVALGVGKIGVRAPEGEFELHTKKVQDEFATFTEGVQKEYEAYKKKQQEDFISFVKEFDMNAGQEISFEGKKVDQNSLSSDTAYEFDEFKKLL